MKLIRRILVLTLACAAVSYPIAFAATSVAQRAAPPHIASASPSQIATSNNTTTISINGSGFDSNARVELMYDVGPGAGQWRLPRHGYQLLNASQIRLTVMPGTDPDQLRIRVVSGNGTSNQTTVRIVASAPKAVAAPKPSVSVTQPSMTTAGSTPPIAPSVQPKVVTPKATPALPTPKIDAITPPSLTASPQPQTITIKGSGFDRETRVEWMYGVGSGAGQWRSPRNTPEVLSSTQIRVAMQSGNDPDRMQIRVVNKQGISNIGNLAIVRPASAATGNVASVTAIASTATAKLPDFAYKSPAYSANPNQRKYCYPQCVEFVRYNFNLPAGREYAKYYWTNPHSGYVNYPQGTKRAPRPGDLLVWGGTLNPKMSICVEIGGCGHVAIVKSVDLNKGLLTRVDANWNGACGVVEHSMTVSGDDQRGYTIAGSGSNHLLGWQSK